MSTADQPLPPMPPNLGWQNSPRFQPITKISDAIVRWGKGQRPTHAERLQWPKVFANYHPEK